MEGMWYLSSLMRRFLLALALPVFLAGTVSCGGPDAKAPDRPRPPYEGRSVEVFDDTIEPRAVGLNLDDARTPRTDPVLRERTQLAEGTARVSVVTVTGRGDGIDIEYVITVKVLDKLGGELPDEMAIYVGKQSPSLGIVKSFDARLGGKTFVAFLKEFRGPDGEPRWHFHFAPDTKDVVEAVKEAYELANFK